MIDIFEMVVAAEMLSGDAAGSEAEAGSYPSRISMDEFVDVERLRSLDAYLAQRVNDLLLQRSDPYFLNQHRLETDSRYETGVREIWLTRTCPETPYDYLDLDRTGVCEFTEAYSIRVDGRFIDEFQKRIPYNTANPASTPAIWAMERGGGA